MFRINNYDVFIYLAATTPDPQTSPPSSLGSPSPRTGSVSLIIVVISVAAAGSLLIVAVIVMICICRKHRDAGRVNPQLTHL